MISPAMCREFLMPTWKRWGDQAHRAGVPIYAVDSDGDVGELIPFAPAITAGGYVPKL